MMLDALLLCSAALKVHGTGRFTLESLEGKMPEETADSPSPANSYTSHHTSDLETVGLCNHLRLSMSITALHLKMTDTQGR